MALQNYPVYRWVYVVAASNSEIETVGGGAGVVPLGNWIAEGDLSADDLIVKFVQGLQAAYLSEPLTPPGPTAVLNSDGTVTITGGADPVEIDWTVPGSPFPPEAVGFNGAVSTLIPAAPGSVTGAFQAANQWHPGIPFFHRSYHVKKHNTFKQPNLKGRQNYLRHGTRSDIELHKYDLIAGARVFDGLAAELVYAANAGVAQSEPNTYEHFLDYVTDTGSNEFYWYDSNDPLVAVRQDLVTFDADEEILEGIDPETFVPSMSSAHFPIKLTMVIS